MNTLRHGARWIVFVGMTACLLGHGLPTGRRGRQILRDAVAWSLGDDAVLRQP